MTTASPPRLLRIDGVLSMTGMSRASVYRAPDFPEPVRLGERASAWVESEVREWIERRIAQRDAGAKPRDNSADRATERRLAKLASMTPDERRAASEARKAKNQAKRARAA